MPTFVAGQIALTGAKAFLALPKLEQLHREVCQQSLKCSDIVEFIHLYRDLQRRCIAMIDEVVPVLDKKLPILSEYLEDIEFMDVVVVQLSHLLYYNDDSMSKEEYVTLSNDIQRSGVLILARCSERKYVASIRGDLAACFAASGTTCFHWMFHLRLTCVLAVICTLIGDALLCAISTDAEHPSSVDWLTHLTFVLDTAMDEHMKTVSTFCGDFSCVAFPSEPNDNGDAESRKQDTKSTEVDIPSQAIHAETNELVADQRDGFGVISSSFGLSAPVHSKDICEDDEPNKLIPRRGTVDERYGTLVDFDGTKFTILQFLPHGSHGNPYVVQLSRTSKSPKRSNEQANDITPGLGSGDRHVIKMVLSRNRSDDRDGDFVARTLKQLEEKEKFFRATLKHLQHENVIKYYSFRQADENVISSGRYMYSVHMEYCDGGSLKRYSTRPGFAFDVQEYLSLIRQVVSGLAYLHYPSETRNSIIHGDISGNNILVKLPGPLFKIGDLDDSNAVCKRDLSGFNEFESVYGTTLHLSPELLHLFAGSKAVIVGRKTDVWSLGCTIVDIYTPGGLQFTYNENGKAVREVVSRHVPMDLVPLVHACHVTKKMAVPDRSKTQPFALDFTELCLQRKVEDRFSSCRLSEMLRDDDPCTILQTEARRLRTKKEDVPDVHAEFSASLAQELGLNCKQQSRCFKQSNECSSLTETLTEEDATFGDLDCSASIEKLPSADCAPAVTEDAETVDTLNEWPDHYIELTPIGHDGSVIAAVDMRNKRHVAIKKKLSNFGDTDAKGWSAAALQAYRELLLLSTFRGHLNILQLLDAFLFQTVGMFPTLCLVTNKMDMDLGFALSNGYIKSEMRLFIMHSILCGTKDLKPSNIGISFDKNKDVCEVRLLNFGLARNVRKDISYVAQTFWYRAPEIWLQPRRYTKSIDIWSVGCIFAELITGQVLMKNSKEHGVRAHMRMIRTYLGKVDEDYKDSLDNMYKDILIDSEDVDHKPISKALPGATDNEIDLLNRIFLWSPDERLTAAQCLIHSCFSDLLKKERHGKLFRGRHPDQNFDDWDNFTPDFWLKRANDQIASIKKDISTVDD